MSVDEILKEREPNKFICALSDYVTDLNLGGVMPADLKRAPALVRGVIFIHAFDLATVNSGIYQWIVELYDGYPQFAKFCDTIKAKKAADYVREAIALFPKGRVPKSLDAKLDFCEEHESELDAIDCKFQGASEDAILKLRDYIASNQNAFELEVQKFWAIRRRHKH